MSKLRSGYTTGSCALAATKCALILLLEERIVSNLMIKTPLNKELYINTYNHQLKEDTASCYVVKDGGDDCDATHGLEIYAYVKKVASGVILKGGQGVGRVTRKGLKVAINESAINPVPRQMITDEARNLCEHYDYRGGIEIEIVVPDGQRASLKTFNARLGIEGGISILGTTGIVEPMSERALIETIKVEIDFFMENNNDGIMLLSPGNYGQEFAREQLNLSLDSAIKYSNFLGECLDYACFKGVKHILIVSHIGKLVKVAGAIMNTHSRNADARNEIFCAYAAINGVDIAILKKIMKAPTTLIIHELLVASKRTNEVYNALGEAIMEKIDYRTQGKIAVEFMAFSQELGILIKSKNVNLFQQKIKEDFK